MSFRYFPLRPFGLAVCCTALMFLAAPSFSYAQEEAVSSAVLQSTRPRKTAVMTTNGTPSLENDIVIISEAAPTSAADLPKDILKRLDPRIDPLKNAPRVLDFQLEQNLLTAIETRLGLPYVFGSQGPRAYDCSGFVWGVFHSAGIDFGRTNARTFWNTFAPATTEERHRFGTLVFFNNLNHVGIVADDRGFYHASSSQGVTYSLFDDYWTPRIDGYRSIPVYDLIALRATR